TYVVNVATDVVTEAANEGVDTVRASVTLTLGNNIENLQLLGTSAINGTGNTLNNSLVGNSAANTLSGAAGNDTLIGAAGNDSLVGGTGADTYRFGLGYGTDTISESDTTAAITDVVEFTGSLTQANIQFRRVGNNLEASILASSDKLVLQNWYLGAQHQVEQFLFSDGTVLTYGQVQSGAL
ncbi:MAG: calcium-binding protein, partial [Cyanobium sp.]